MRIHSFNLALLEMRIKVGPKRFGIERSQKRNSDLWQEVAG